MATQIKKSKVTNTNGRGRETYERYLLSIPKEIAEKYMGVDLLFVETSAGLLLRTSNISIGDVCDIRTDAVLQSNQLPLNGLYGTVLSIKNDTAILKVDIKGKYHKLPFGFSELKIKQI